MNSARRDLTHICFAGKTPTSQRPAAREVRRTALAGSRQVENLSHNADERLDEFIAWVLGQAGLDAAAYRPQPLNRRLPACLRAMKVGSARAARDLLLRKPCLVTKVVSSLLIGVTEFFREPDTFDFLATRVLPAWADGKRRLRVWSAACSSGAELYSMAILLSDAGLLECSDLLGSDCRGDAIERARLGLYDATVLKLVPRATRDKYFRPAGPQWRPAEALRRQTRWTVTDVLARVEHGPWDIIFWRNTAIYLQPSPAERIWRQLATALTPQGLLIAGKAERPPRDAGLTPVARGVWATGRERPPRRSVNGTDPFHTEHDGDAKCHGDPECHGGHSLQERSP